MNSGVITFLDRDHILRIIWCGLCDTAPGVEQEIKEAFGPERFDIGELSRLAVGLREQDGYRIIYGVDSSEALKETTSLIYRRGNISAELIAAAPSLKFVQRLGGRVDGIDVGAVRASNVAVSCLPRPVLAYTAEHALLLMLSLSKRVVEADKIVRLGTFEQSQVSVKDNIAYNWPGLRKVSGLFGKTLGIVGLGEVGALVAQRAAAFGMHIIYTNRSRLSSERESVLNVSYRTMDRLLHESDFVSLHASNIGENDRLFGDAEFTSMKPSAFFINTSRGRLVDEDALYRALERNTIAGAGIDVHRIEPRLANDRFAMLPNVIMTPHIAGGSRAELINEVRCIYENLRAVEAGQLPVHGTII